jgi:DNA-binding MarR family transcriptional regulator
MGVSIDPGVVRTLRAVRDCDDEAGVGDVATWLGVDASTASRLVDRAVALGYLDRGVSSGDRRRTALTVTAAGADILERAVEVREALLGELTAGWSDDDVRTLADLLERLARRVSELEKRP